MTRNCDQQLFSLAYWGPRLGLLAMGLHLLFSALCLSGMGPYQGRADGASGPLGGLLPVCAPSGLVYVDSGTPDGKPVVKAAPCDLCLLSAMSLMLAAGFLLRQTKQVSETALALPLRLSIATRYFPFASRAPPVSV